MKFAFSAEQDMLREAVRGFLESRMPSSRVRELMESDSGFASELWDEMSQMGWPAMHIPEEYGGAGFTFVELGIVLEEMGRTLATSPLFASVVLGANLLLVAGSDEQKEEHLPGVAAGETRVAVAIVEEAGGWAAADITTTARRHGGDVVLNGTKSFVIDGHTADLIVVAAVDTESGDLGFYLVPAGATGLSADKLETMDMTRKQARVSLDDVSVPATMRLTGAAGSGGDVLAGLYDLAVVGLAYEQVGGAVRCMEMSVAYAKERMQFGRPIGSFQAVKHTCANMLVSVESARSAAYHAGWAAAEDPNELPIAAAIAKSYCSDAYFTVAADTIQVHGGIGFTWEHDAHLYFKRAKSSQLMFGSPAQWRSRLGDQIGISSTSRGTKY